MVKTGSEALAISFSTLLARKLLLHSWKSEKVPTFEMMLNEQGNVLHLEKMKYILSTREEIFLKFQPFLNLMTQS